MGTYHVGDLVRCSGSFSGSDGNLADPAAVVFRWKPDGQSASSYTYGSGSELARDGTGLYHVDVTAGSTGKWHYRFESTGSGQAAEEASFQVLRTEF